MASGQNTPTHLVALKPGNSNSFHHQKLEIDGGMQNAVACDGGHKKNRCRPFEIPYQFSPAENPFVGDDRLIPAAFDLHELTEIVKAQSTICNACLDDSCMNNCRIYDAFILAVKQSVSQLNVRLHLVPVDTLAWMRNAGMPEAYEKLLLKFTALLTSQHDYLTFKGSDYVFTCLDENCPAFLDDLGAALSSGLGTRAIFAGVDLELGASLWPCPLRVIKLNRSEAEDAHFSLKKIVQQATFMIHQRNRWICSDDQHPPNHWDNAIFNRNLGGAFMKE